ncbi:hypothetical protein vseg_012030 [Gypsophila vaccaria]
MGVMMDNYSYNCDNGNSKDRHVDGDIEKGELNVKLGSGLVFGGDAKMGGLCFESSDDDGLLSDMSMRHDERGMLSVGSSSDDDSESVRLIVVNKKVEEGKESGGFERKVVKEKAVAMSAKKPPKPPRPPRGLSLDSADQKLIRELHELARLKRARVERMKALKKSKEAKAASSKNQLFATLLTVLFCLVLFLQGISSRASKASSVQGPTFSSELAGQHNNIFDRHPPLGSSATNHNGSPRLVEQVSGVDTTEHVSRAVG